MQAMTGEMDGTTNACRYCGGPVVRLPNCRWCGMFISTIGEAMDWLSGEGRTNYEHDDDTIQAPQPAQHHD